jgi:hypothetical protein
MIDWTDWTPPQYTRDDVDYETWYSEHAKNLALLHTRAKLESFLGITSGAAHKASAQHHAAVKATTSMTSQSQLIAIRGAIEIHHLFPEHARGDGS